MCHFDKNLKEKRKKYIYIHRFMQKQSIKWLSINFKIYEKLQEKKKISKANWKRNRLKLNKEVHVRHFIDKIV